MELSTVDHSHWEKGDESKEVLRRGQTDTFKFAIKSLRNLTHVTRLTKTAGICCQGHWERDWLILICDQP